MKVSLNWVREYTKLILPPDELRERISVSLTEVESIEQFADRYKSIVVAEVKKAEKHPVSDDHLILTLDTGGRIVQTVVQKCQVKVGDKVPYLPPGTAIPGEICDSSELGIKNCVTSTKIKGVDSQGMVPSGREIGLNYDHTTVYTLPSDTKPGTMFNQTLDLTDVIIEIKNKPLTHRPDVFSVEGFAREVAAIQRTPYTGLSWLENWESLKPSVTEDRLPVSITNDAKALCPRYMAVVLDNVTIGQSPKWMQIRLAKVGIRPVNNVVDVSNYLMIEAGQPNHMFDYDKIIKKDTSFNGTAVIQIRLAKVGEKITTLDGEVHELYDDTIVIADSVNPIGIAGVMGGKDTEIDDDTKRIIFQVENLEMFNVRRTSMKMGIFSDAVTRFSRGLDPNRCEPVLYKGIQMLQELTGATVASVVKDNYESPLRARSITFSPQDIRRKIGFELPDEEMMKILGSLSLAPVADQKNMTITANIPTWRKDLSITEDIVEEVVRIYGFDRIIPTLPMRHIVPITMNVARRNRLRMKEILAESGGHEIYTYSFVGQDLYQACELELTGAYKLKNPLSPELSYMRPVLLPSILDKAKLNVKSYESFALFEVDMVNPVKDIKERGGELRDEPWHAGLVNSRSYYHAKHHLDVLIRELHVAEYEIVPSQQADVADVPEWVHYLLPLFNASRTGYVRVGGIIVGMIGQLVSEVTRSFELGAETSAWELRFDDLQPFVRDTVDYADPSKYPAVVHDLCFVSKAAVAYRTFEQAIQAVDSKKMYIKKVECRDIYVDPSHPDSKKTTLRVTIQSDEKTLSNDEIEKIRRDIIAQVERSTKATLAE